MKTLLHSHWITDAAEDVHAGLDEGGCVGEAAGRMHPLDLDLLDPLHLLEVEHAQVVGEGVC